MEGDKLKLNSVNKIQILSRKGRKVFRKDRKARIYFFFANSTFFPARQAGLRVLREKKTGMNQSFI
jgi:hypothetical protein